MGRALLAAVAGVGLLVLFVGGSVFYLSWSACLGGERAALKEFPHYADPQSGPRSLQGACEVRYTTEASKEEVLGYYDERLRQNGWRVLGYEAHHPFKRGIGGEYDRLSEALRPQSRRLRASLPVGTATTTGLATNPQARRTQTSRTTEPS